MTVTRPGLGLAVVAAVGLAAEGRAGAQALGLPHIDNINIFIETGKFFPAADLVTDELGLLYGWGFETSFEVRHVGPERRWLLELAVGYEQIGGIVSRNGNYRVDGSLRDLPSIAAYLTQDTGFYFGIKSGLVKLRDFQAYDLENRPYGVSGDTIMLGASVGYLFDSGLALELAYHVRWFPGVTYTLPSDQSSLPDDLPGSLGMHGLTFSFAYQISIRSRRAPATAMARSPDVGATPVALVAGPARITSYGFVGRRGAGHAQLYLVAAGGDCAAPPTTILGWVPGVTGEIVVPEDTVACARADTDGTLSWTGYGP